jgi:spore coat polysaccharide biosynthesis protein SpsF
MKVVAIIQARMSSTRLPGKVLMPLAGKPVLAHVVQRSQACRQVDEVVVATSADSSDDALEQWCAHNQVHCYRGSLNDVLDRYYQAAKLHGADAIVRITADCPAIDSHTVDEVIQGFIQGGFEFYGLSGEFPDGLDCTVFSFRAIEKAWQEAKLPSEREHVGPYIEKNPLLFKNGGLKKYTGLSHMRWTLDEPRDYEFLCQVFDQLAHQDKLFTAEDVLALLNEQPELQGINQTIVRNEGYLKSLAAEGTVHV